MKLADCRQTSFDGSLQAAPGRHRRFSIPRGLKNTETRKVKAPLLLPALMNPTEGFASILFINRLTVSFANGKEKVIMNTKMFKGVGAATSLFVGLGAASPVLADSSTSVQLLGGTANSIDVWTFSCPIGARARVFDVSTTPVNAAARMQAVLGKDGDPTREVTDLSPPPTGEGDGSSPFAVVIDGPGLYAVAFKKTAGGVERYEGQAACVNADGVVTSNPVLTKRIDQ
jgi:hypothetical protein